LTAAAVFSTAFTGDVAVMGDEGSLGGDAAFTLGVRALFGGIVLSNGRKSYATTLR